MNKKIAEKLKEHILRYKQSVYSFEFIKSIAEAREQVKRGETYSVDEARKMLGL